MTEKILSGFDIKPFPKEARFRFRLLFRGQSQPVEFYVSFHGGMTLLNVLRRFQARYKLPIPLHRPQGRPKLYDVNRENPPD